MNAQSRLTAYQTEVEQFCKRVEERFQPDCIILHGSVARGTSHLHSDIDLIVVGGRLSTNFFERSYELNRLRDSQAPLEVVGYTLQEWEKMMEGLHLTVLEALNWGIPLYGKARFEQWKARLEEWKAAGLHRAATSWVIPPSLR